MDLTFQRLMALTNYILKSKSTISNGLLEVTHGGLKHVDIYTINGQLVRHQAINEGDRVAIPLAPSAYIIKVTTDKGSFTKKLICH